MALHELHPEWAIGGPTAGSPTRKATCGSAPPAATSRSAPADRRGDDHGAGRRRHLLQHGRSRRTITAGSSTASATAMPASRGSAPRPASRLPTASDIEDPTYRRYVAFTGEVVFIEATDGRDERGLRPDPRSTGRPTMAAGSSGRIEHGAASPAPRLAVQRVRQHEVGGRSLRTVSSNASVDFVDYPVRHVAVSPERQRLRLAQALANGGGLDYS